MAKIWWNVFQWLRCQYLKSARIWSYSGLYFPALGLNTEIYRVSLHIQSECGKILTRITPNKDTFCAVCPVFNYRFHGECFYEHSIASVDFS